MWMFGITKSTSELAAVARTPLCRYQLGLGIYNVQAAVNGMEGWKRSYLFSVRRQRLSSVTAPLLQAKGTGLLRSGLLSLCGQLLRRVLIPYHIKSDPGKDWIRETALSYAADLDGHVLGTLCAVTMAILTNRLDLCIQGLFGAGKSKSMAILILALLELDVDRKLTSIKITRCNWDVPSGKLT